MAFSSNRLSERMEELRFPSLRSPEHDSSFGNGAGPGRVDSSYFANMPQSNDARVSLQRRFTTDSSKTSMSRPFSSQYGTVNAQTVCHPFTCSASLYESHICRRFRRSEWIFQWICREVKPPICSLDLTFFPINTLPFPNISI